MSKWTEYTGSDEQIAELKNARNGYILMNTLNQQSEISKTLETNALRRGSSDRRILLNCSEVTHYWITPDDPLRDMKIRQAQTGQPVWVKVDRDSRGNKINMIYTTTTPDWNIPDAEYSFIEFKEEV